MAPNINNNKSTKEKIVLLEIQLDTFHSFIKNQCHERIIGNSAFEDNFKKHLVSINKSLLAYIFYLKREWTY